MKEESRLRLGASYANTQDGIGRILEQVGSLLVDLCGEHSIPELDKSLTGAWSVRNQLVSRHAQESLSCAIIAMTKSGKSTLINALVGDELLPMNNVPETARICKVVHTERAHQPYMMEPASSLAQQQAKRQSHSDSVQGVEQAVITCRGGPAIRARLQELNHAIRSHDSLSSSPSASSQLLSPMPSFREAQEPRAAAEGPGSDVGEPEGAAPLIAPEGGSPMTVDRNMLAIHTHIAALRAFAEGSKAEAGRAGGSPPVRLHLLDTPGPNEAGEAGLRYQVERLLGTVDAAVYLLDYTKLKTADEASMFERLKEINPALVRRLSQRLFIAVNKVDASLVSEGQDAEATREYVAELVTQQMACEGFQLRPDQVLLLSARNALLSRRVLCDGWPKPGDASAAAAGGPAAAETRARFAQLAFGRFASPDAISPEAAVAAAHALLEDSGVPELEAQVLAHLYNHSGSVKQLALVDDLGRLLAEVRNMSASCAGALSAGAESLEARTRALREELTTTLQAFDGVHAHADAITTGVTSEVRAHLHTLRGRLFSHIISALDTSSPPPASSSPSSTAGPLVSKSASRWQRVRERFLSIFTSPRMHPVPGSISTKFPQDGGSFCSTKDAMMAAAGAVVARSRSKSELAGLLAALHDDLTHQIHAEVSEFWSVLETVAAARHAELLGVLNKHLQELSAKVEAAVSCSLDVRLAPVKLALAPQNIAQFHCSLEALIAAGVVESRERHIRVGQRQVNERIKRPSPGICRWGHYWEDVPHMRTVVEAYTTSVYELAPSEITKLFINMVDSAISATESQLEAYVSKFVGGQLSQARQELERYSESYLGTMTSALEVGQMGAEHRLAALDKVKAVLGRVDTLGAEVDALLATVEQGVPRAREPCIAFDDLEELEELEVSSTVGAAAAAAEGLKQNVTSVKGALAPEEHAGGDGAPGDLQHQKQEQQGTLEGVSSGERQQAAAVMGLVQAAAAAASAAGYAGGAGAADGRLWQQPTEQLQPQQQELEQEQRDGETWGQRGQASGAGSPPSSPIAATETAGQCDVLLGLPVTNASVHTGRQKEQDATAGVLAAQPDEPDAHHGSAAGAEFDLQHLTASQASLGESAVQVPAVQGAAVDEASSCKGEHLPAPSSPGSNTGSCCDEWAVVEGNGKQEQQQQ